MGETEFKNKIRPMLEALPNTVVFKIQQASISGTPDFLLCINGLFVALELKKGKGAYVSKLQRHYLEKIVQCNGCALLVFPENWEECYNNLKAIAYQNAGIPEFPVIN